MTTGIVFRFANELVEVRVDGFNCLFRTSQFGGAFAPIDALRLDKAGVIREFPDLKDEEDWREQALTRFKEKIKTYATEKLRMEYIIQDLKKYGYIPLYWQEQGFRPKKL